MLLTSMEQRKSSNPRSTYRCICKSVSIWIKSEKYQMKIENTQYLMIVSMHRHTDGQTDRLK